MPALLDNVDQRLPRGATPVMARLPADPRAPVAVRVSGRAGELPDEPTCLPPIDIDGRFVNHVFTRMRHGRLLVHAILGIRPPETRLRPGPDFQDRMDQRDGLLIAAEGKDFVKDVDHRPGLQKNVDEATLPLRLDASRSRHERKRR